jgi:CubicO group peptidase (beta-lactamase class C family)
MILRHRISVLRNPLEAEPENPVQTKQFPAAGIGTPPLGTDVAVAAMMRKGHIPGLSVAVVDRDRLRFAAGYGAADRAANTPSTPETSYLWFSMTKVVTATAAVRLADEGRLDLDAPAGEYLPELRGRRDPGPTVRQLLTHTAGLSNPLPLRWTHPMDVPPPDPRSLLSRLLTRRRAFTHPAGRIARYSNVGYLAAGEIISAAAAMPYTEYVQQYVLQPLGMSNTGFRYAPGPAKATGYLRAPRIADPALRTLLPDGIAGEQTGPFLSLKPFYVDGPAYGGLVGDVQDAGRFLRAHLNDGALDGKRVLTSRTTQEMRCLDHRGKPFDHGIGWFRRSADRTGDWVEHYGAGAGFWNVMRLYPDRGIGIVVMANITSRYDFDSLFTLLAARDAPATRAGRSEPHPWRSP